MFGHTVFNIIKGLSMSDRGEYEIADVINEYISIKNISYSFISGFWTDAGTLESYRLANENMYE
jgi:glucose-1-phosphate thymidylyltransferase